jgi:hypothetical protein
MCYPYRPALRLGPVAAQSFYTSPRGGAYSWTTLSERLHPASSPTKDAFLGHLWSHSGSSIVRTCSRLDNDEADMHCALQQRASCFVSHHRRKTTSKFKHYLVSGYRRGRPKAEQGCSGCLHEKTAGLSSTPSQKQESHGTNSSTRLDW